MELKDVILTTLAEMEDNSAPINNISKPTQQSTLLKNETVKSEEIKEVQNLIEDESVSSDEMLFLTSMRERLLVLFEGFQAPNNKNIEAKVDMTLNFLEYMLATIDSRVESLKKDGKNE